MTRVRKARPEDAHEISSVLIASIRQLCTADHRNDPDAVVAWIANKTPEQVGVWLEGDHGVYVALQDREIVAAGAISDAGEIMLLYAAPAHLGAGHGKALLAALEKELAKAGHDEARLVSTKTAHGFFLSQGWRNDGPEVANIRAQGQPMRKRLRQE